MKTTKRIFNQPGKWEERISFAKVGEEKEWVGVIDARSAGDYELVVTAEHKVENTKGKITVRVVVGEGARVRVKGKIRIEKKGQATEDFLELRALTLGQTAVVTLEPELEILANNVRASHVASSGPIDPEQLAYLQSKGLTIELAREEIIAGWINASN